MSIAGPNVDERTAATANASHAVYERIVVAGREFVSARLTPAAYAHGLALALPEQVVKARPTGVRRSVTATIRRVPIEQGEGAP